MHRIEINLNLCIGRSYIILYPHKIRPAFQQIIVIYIVDLKCSWQTRDFKTCLILIDDFRGNIHT